VLFNFADLVIYLFIYLLFLCYEDDDPETVKARLRQWAQVVGCAVRQSSS
jgi:hypothetical protein